MVRLADSFSPPKLKDYLLGVILFLAPTQLGLHFWPASALVYGVRIDYLSPTLYFLDFLIVVFLMLQKFRLSKLPHSLILILLVNFLYSHNPLATLSWSLHFLLYLSFVLSLQIGKKLNSLTIIRPALYSALLFQILLAALQVWSGHSLQGIFYYLGERLLSVGQPGVALASFNHNLTLRAYATFSHPNVLAGWLLVTLLILRVVTLKPIMLFISYLLVGFGIFLTQSRSAAIVFFGLILPLYVFRSLRAKTSYILLLLVTCYSLVFSGLLSRPLDLSLRERLALQQNSLSLISHYPFLGTGANASISTYPDISPNFRLLQPDHNSFTLFLSWFGFFGFFVIIYYLLTYFDFRISNFVFLISYFEFRISDFVFRFSYFRSILPLLPLLPLLLLDHYFLTSPQGMLILLLYLAIAKNKLSYSHA